MYTGADIDIIEDDIEIFSKMNKFWVSLSGKGNKIFWNHEYNKHSYCYNQKCDLDVNDYKKYFEKTMEIFEDNNLGKLIINLLLEKKVILIKIYIIKLKKFWELIILLFLVLKLKEILKLKNNIYLKLEFQ